jgi:hypothetical protein
MTSGFHSRIGSSYLRQASIATRRIFPIGNSATAPQNIANRHLILPQAGWKDEVFPELIGRTSRSSLPAHHFIPAGHLHHGHDLRRPDGDPVTQTGRCTGRWNPQLA